MNTETAHALCDITSAFYRDHAASFSSTRHAAWAGWEKCLAAAGFSAAGPTCGGFPLRVIDVACGNMRFLSFLEERLDGASFEYLAVDNCAPLAESMPRAHRSHVSFRALDIARTLLGEEPGDKLDAAFGEGNHDLAACFGFFHHVPTVRARAALLRALVRSVRPGGVVAVSFWQFENSPDLARKANETTACALDELGIRNLDEGDYLVGWQNKPHAYRYCHSFTTAEIDALAARVADKACVLARFEADGRTGNLNGYLVLQRKG